MQTVIREYQKTRSPGKSSRWALVGLSLAMLLSSLGTSSANVALPDLAQSFDAAFQEVQWVVIAYLMAITMLIASIGRLGDIIGRRRLLLIGISLFTGASILCGLGTTLGWLIAARTVQGFGAASMMALSLALVGEIMPKARTGTAMGLLGSMSAIGTALGPSLGGILISWQGWEAIFFVNVPLGILALLFAYRYLPADRQGESASQVRFDLPGTLAMSVTLAAYALAMTLGRGDFGMLNFVLLGIALFGTGFFLLVESRSKAPLIQLALFRDREFSLSLSMSAVVSTVLMATLVVGPFYLSRALRLETAVVGTVMSVGPIMVIFAGVPFGRLVDQFGAELMTRIGLAGIAVGSLALGLLPMTTGVPGFVAPMIVITLGYAMFQTANNTAVMKDVHSDRRGVISGLLNLSRNLGLITGASAMGAVFAFASGATDVAVADPDSISIGFRITFLLATSLVAVLLAVVIVGKSFIRSEVSSNSGAS